VAGNHGRLLASTANRFLGAADRRQPADYITDYTTDQTTDQTTDETDRCYRPTGDERDRA
jgi:hypothetical protein